MRQMNKEVGVMESKEIHNHFEKDSNCQVFQGPISNCVFAMPGSVVRMGKEKADDAEVEEEEEPRRSDSCPFVARSEQSEDVVAYIRQLMAGKESPKDILKPLRAAQDAGVIRRPSWGDYKSAFPRSGVKNKSSLTKYTDPVMQPYQDDNSFAEMVEDFKKRFLSR